MAPSSTWFLRQSSSTFGQLLTAAQNTFVLVILEQFIKTFLAPEIFSSLECGWCIATSSYLFKSRTISWNWMSTHSPCTHTSLVWLEKIFILPCRLWNICPVAQRFIEELNLWPSVSIVQFLMVLHLVMIASAWAYSVLFVTYQSEVSIIIFSRQ